MATMKPRSIIPEGWEAHHRPILDTAMTAICELRGPQAYDHKTGQQVPGELLADDIPCRVHGLSADRGGSPSANLVDQHSLDVIAPIDRIPQLGISDDGPILYVTGYKEGHLGDPHLIGLPLRVTNLHLGSLQWERILTATTEV